MSMSDALASVQLDAGSANGPLANNLNREQLAVARQKGSAPLTIYEQCFFGALADGRLQLVSQ